MTCIWQAACASGLVQWQAMLFTQRALVDRWMGCTWWPGMLLVLEQCSTACSNRCFRWYWHRRHSMAAEQLTSADILLAIHESVLEHQV
jgi:hypothetical protein